MDPYSPLQAAVGSSEVLPCVGAAVRSSDEGLYHQANINDGQTRAYWERGLRAHTERARTRTCVSSVNLFYLVFRPKASEEGLTCLTSSARCWRKRSVWP